MKSSGLVGGLHCISLHENVQRTSGLEENTFLRVFRGSWVYAIQVVPFMCFLGCMLHYRAGERLDASTVRCCGLDMFVWSACRVRVGVAMLHSFVLPFVFWLECHPGRYLSVFEVPQCCLRRYSGAVWRMFGRSSHEFLNRH